MCLWAESPSEGDRHYWQRKWARDRRGRKWENRKEGRQKERKTGKPIRRKKERQAGIDRRRGEGRRRESKRQTELRISLSASLLTEQSHGREQHKSLSGNTSVFWCWWVVSNFPSLLAGLFHVVSLIGTVVLSGIRALIASLTICGPDSCWRLLYPTNCNIHRNPLCFFTNAHSESIRYWHVFLVCLFLRFPKCHFQMTFDQCLLSLSPKLEKKYCCGNMGW